MTLLSLNLTSKEISCGTVVKGVWRTVPEKVGVTYGFLVCVCPQKASELETFGTQHLNTKRWPRWRITPSNDELSKNVNICCYCNKKCMKRSEAVQCDLCYSWLHASCEGLSKEQYKLLTQLTSTVDNVMYYCKLNKCETRSKQLMFNSIHKALFPFDNSETDETEPLMLEQNAIRKEISDLSAKVNALCSMYENLEKEIKSTASSIAQSSVPTTHSYIECH